MVDSIDITFDIDDTRATAMLNKKIQMFDNKINELIRDILNMGRRNVSDEAPRKTGRLKSATQIKQMGLSGGIIFVSTRIAPHFTYVYEGTRPHSIYPKNGLALWWKGAAYPVKNVNHPGTKANKYVDRGADRLEVYANKRFNLFSNWLGGD